MSKVREIPRSSNDVSLLETPLQQIIKLVEKLPSQYRESAFEKLLENVILNLNSVHESSNGAEQSQDEYIYKMPIEVAAFLGQFNIPEKDINQYFLITGPTEISPKYRIKVKSSARAQTQLACLLALERALHDGKFEFSFDEVKNKCKEYNCLDRNNFVTNFRLKKTLFKSIEDKEHVLLSPIGKEYLADVLDELSSKA